MLSPFYLLVSVEADDPRAALDDLLDQLDQVENAAIRPITAHGITGRDTLLTEILQFGADL